MREKLLKSRLLAVTTGIVLAAMLTACSSSATSSSTASETQSSASGTRTIKDTNGNDVEIPAEVTKVAPTIGAFAAVTAMLGASDEIVAAATSAISDRFKETYPDYEKANPNNYDTKNVEDIIASGAQVAFGPDSLTEDQISQLNGAGVSFVTVDKLSTVDEMASSYEVIGEILGGEHQEKATRLAETYRSNAADAAKRTAGLSDDQRVPTMELRAGSDQYSTINSKDISNEFIESAGGRNVAADFTAAGQGTGLTVSAEQVVAWNPAMIFTLTQDSKAAILADPALATVDAVRNQNVQVCPSGVYAWCVRSAEGALTPYWLGTLLQPELFSDIDMVDQVKDFYKEYATEPDDEGAREILAGPQS